MSSEYIDFQTMLWEYFEQAGRDLPWRQSDVDGNFDPYKILVSEIMLQQTQVVRVIPKYYAFLEAFPTVQVLAEAPLAAVLSHWSGLGYNRRAKYLHEAAKQLVSKKIWTIEDLTACKGIGHNTAAAVVTYAYNQPQAFIETNIRTVYIHHFFADRDDVADKEIQPLVEATIDKDNPREFFWALMDYGSHLKQTVGNESRRSRHYAKQSAFQGSLRQLRGKVLRSLIAASKDLSELTDELADERLESVLSTLETEGLIKSNRGKFYLA